MKVDIKELNPCRRLLQIEVGSEVVTDRFKKVYKDFEKSARIPGFRPGKAPQHIVKLHYKEQIKEEVLKSLIPDFYQQAMKENSLIPVDLPEVTEVKFEEGEPFLFKVTVDIKPSIKPGNYLGLKVSEKKVEVTDEDAEKTLKQLQESSAHYVVVETRPAKMDDYVSIDFECLVEKELISQRKNFWMVLNGTSLLPGFGKATYPELTEGLVGMERSQEKRIDLTLREDFPKKEYARKKAVFMVFLNEIKEKHIPSLDDEFARGLGEFENLNGLRTAIKKDLINKARTQSRIDLEGQIIEQLLKNSKFALPDSLVRKQTERLVKEAKTQLLYKGIKKEEIEKQEENLRKGLKEKAVRQVKAGLILGEIAALQKIEAKEQETEQKIVRMAAELRQEPDKLKGWLKQEGLLDNLKTEIKTAKTLDFLLEKAVIKKGGK